MPVEPVAPFPSAPIGAQLTAPRSSVALRVIRMSRKGARYLLLTLSPRIDRGAGPRPAGPGDPRLALWNKVEDTNKLLERSLISVPPPVNRAADHEPCCDEDEVLDHKFSGHGQQ